MVTAARNEEHGQGTVMRLCWFALEIVSRNLSLALLKSLREPTVIFFFLQKESNENLCAKILHVKL